MTTATELQPVGTYESNPTGIYRVRRPFYNARCQYLPMVGGWRLQILVDFKPSNDVIWINVSSGLDDGGHGLQYALDSNRLIAEQQAAEQKADEQYEMRREWAESERA